MLSPAEMVENSIAAGERKVHYPIIKSIILGILAGMFIAFSSECIQVVSYSAKEPWLMRILQGTLFPIGLMMVIMSGAELFTGNTLIITSVLGKKVSPFRMLRNWAIVYFSNMVGAFIVVTCIYFSGQLDASSGELGAYVLSVAARKTSMPFINCFFSGILCNVMVCMAVWMASAASDVAGKLLSAFFPICLFISSGFEHSVANMYYIGQGLFSADKYSTKAAELGIDISSVTPAGMVANLIPVTLGNIAGGMVLVGIFMYLGHVKFTKQNS